MARVVTWQRIIAAVLMTAVAAGSRYAAADDDAATPSTANFRTYTVGDSSRTKTVKVIRPTVYDQVQPATQTEAAPDAGQSPSDEPTPMVDSGPGEQPSAGRSSGACCLECDQCGGNVGCCRCCQCGPPGRFWIRDEFLGWNTNGDHLPALLTTGPANGSPPTTVVYGNNTVANSFAPGNWVQFGGWLDPCRQWGLQADYLFLGGKSAIFNDNSDNNPVLARPFTNALTGNPGAELIGYPGTVVGSVNINDNTSFQGAGLTGRYNLHCKSGCLANVCNDGCFQGQNCYRLDALAGFRYYRLTDNLTANEYLTSTSTTNGVAVGTQINVADSFRTTNNFYGGEIGLVLNRYYGRWFAEGTTKVALGDVQQTATINGSTVVTYPGIAPAVSRGGLLALPSNIGTYHRDEFTAIPQLSGRVGYQLTQRLSLIAGYTWIYWGQVAKAAGQIDTTVNPNLLPNSGQTGGPNRPAFAFHDNYFWAQGVTLGLEYHF